MAKMDDNLRSDVTSQEPIPAQPAGGELWRLALPVERAEMEDYLAGAASAELASLIETKAALDPHFAGELMRLKQRRANWPTASGRASRRLRPRLALAIGFTIIVVLAGAVIAYQSGLRPPAHEVTSPMLARNAPAGLSDKYIEISLGGKACQVANAPVTALLEWEKPAAAELERRQGRLQFSGIRYTGECGPQPPRNSEAKVTLDAVLAPGLGLTGAMAEAEQAIAAANLPASARHYRLSFFVPLIAVPGDPLGFKVDTDLLAPAGSGIISLALPNGFILNQPTPHDASHGLVGLYAADPRDGARRNFAMLANSGDRQSKITSLVERLSVAGQIGSSKGLPAVIAGLPVDWRDLSAALSSTLTPVTTATAASTARILLIVNLPDSQWAKPCDAHTVQGQKEQAKQYQTLLISHGHSVQTTGTLPGSVEALLPYDVILIDASNLSICPAKIEALKSYLRQGGGLVLLASVPLMLSTHLPPGMDINTLHGQTYEYNKGDLSQLADWFGFSSYTNVYGIQTMRLADPRDKRLHLPTNYTCNGGAAIDCTSRCGNGRAVILWDTKNAAAATTSTYGNGRVFWMSSLRFGTSDEQVLLTGLAWTTGQLSRLSGDIITSSIK